MTRSCPPRPLPLPVTDVTAFLDGIDAQAPRIVRSPEGAHAVRVWLETIASEPVQRGPNALPPQCAAALLEAWDNQVDPARYGRDAWLALSWIANQGRSLR